MHVSFWACVSKREDQNSAKGPFMQLLFTILLTAWVTDSKISTHRWWACKSCNLLQIYSHMARRGQLYGVATTYIDTWLFKADGLGNLWVSDAILYNEQSSPISVSVVEVRLWHLNLFCQWTQDWKSCTKSMIIVECWSRSKVLLACELC